MPKTWGAKTADQRQVIRRERLVRAAINVYGEQGYRNTSVKAVCRAAGLTERYFYESFANGEDLLRQCFIAVEEDLLRRMRAAAFLEGLNTSDRARSGLLVYLRHVREDPATARVFLIEMANVSAAADELVLESLDRFGSILMEVLGADPRFGCDPSPLLLRGVVGGGLYMVRAWIASGYAESVETVADATLRLYVALMRSPPTC